MKLYKALLFMLLASILLVACAPGEAPAAGVTQTPVPPTEESQPTATLTPWDAGVPQPMAADAAQQALADRLGISPEQLTLREIEQVEWPNACLGLAQADEMCAEVITPGFRLIFEANSQSYEVHTNQDGSQLRFADNPAVNMPSSGQIIPAVAAAQVALAEQLGVSVDRIQLIEATPEEWSDSCLGAGRPDESCLQVITPGYRIILEMDGIRYQIHTNIDGSIYRFVGMTDQGARPGTDPTIIVSFVQNLLAQQLGIPVNQVTLVTLEAVDWPDACLGVSLPAQVCAQVITPGYRLVFEAQGVHYAFHTDDAGGVILPAIPPLPETAGTVVDWQQEEGNACSQAEIGVQGVSFGECSGAQQDAELSPERVLELAYLYATYSPFEMETSAGEVQFLGQGVQAPSEAEMRSVAEWARLVSMEAEAGSGEPPAGIAIDWTREGGFAGFCDGLAVSVTGWALPSSCRSETPVNFLPLRMQTEDLEQLYAWTDTLESFQYEQSDNAAADSMTIQVVFNGNGTEQAEAAQQEAIAQFAADLYNQLMQ